jgi:CubicO group peptidase (beta-lactamase class C family)
LIPEHITTEWDARVARVRQEFDLPGLSVAVAAGDGFLWTATAGESNRESGTPVAPDDLFRVASITKLFTAVGVMTLVERGLVELDSAVSDIVSELPASPATIRQFLCHGSGLQRETPDDPGWETGVFAIGEDLVKALPGTRFPFAPMERWKYSNLGYDLLGEVIERIGGKPYVEFVQKEVIEALGLENTSLEPTGDLAERRAHGYLSRPDTDWTEPDERAWMDFPPAAAGLYSTPSDLCCFAQFLAGARPGPLQEETLALMRRPVLVAGQDRDRAHGLGPMVIWDGEARLVGHSGGLYSFAAWMLASPETGVAATALTNVGDGEGLLPLVKSLIREGSTATGPLPTPTVAPPPEVEPLLGRYLGDATVMVLTWRGGRLYADTRGRSGPTISDEIGIDPDGTYTFMDGSYAGEMMTVERDDAGTVTGFEVCTYRFRRV